MLNENETLKTNLNFFFYKSKWIPLILISTNYNPSLKTHMG